MFYHVIYGKIPYLTLYNMGRLIMSDFTYQLPFIEEKLLTGIIYMLKKMK